MLPDRKAYEDKLDAQLAQWDADLTAFKARVRRTEVDAMIHYDQAVQSLQRGHDQAGIQLGHLKAVSDELWGTVKDGTDKAWQEIRTLFQRSKDAR